jgi:O-antigen/teichoic acid export membrane protein
VKLDLKRVVLLTIGRVDPGADAERRNTRVLQAALSAVAGKGVAIAVGLISVPLTVGYLGAERYGAWVTLSGLLAWIQIADVGLGNGLTNALSESYGADREDVAQAHIATALWLLTAIALVLGVVFACAWPFIDWARVFNVHSDVAVNEIGGAMAAAVALFLVAFPLAAVEKVFAARQEGAVGNAWAAAANLASLGALLLVTRTRGGLALLVAALSGARLLVVAASALWLFGRRAPRLRPSFRRISRPSARRLIADGGHFLVVQLAALAIYETDNLIIAQVLGPEYVTPYAVAWRLFTIPTFVMTLVFPFVWPAYAEAFARGDGPWIKRMFRLTTWFGGAASLLLAIPLVLFGRAILVFWAGPAADPPPGLLPWMGAWAVVSSLFMSIACMLNAAGRLRGQVIFGSLTAAANVALSIVLARSHGITGVIAATVISYLIFAFVPLGVVEARLTLARVDGK